MGRGFVAVVTLLAFVLTGGGGPGVWRALAADEIAEQVRLTGHVLPALARSTELPRPWYAAAATFISDAVVGTPLTITVVLKRSDPQGFDRYLRDVYDRDSPSYRRFLSQAELARRFGPSQGAYDTVLRHLEAAGLALVEGSANRLTLTMSATRARAERVFGVRINDYRIGDRAFFANDREPAVPADIAAHVQAIIGLSNLATPHPVSAADPLPVALGGIAVIVLGSAAGAAFLGLFGGLLIGSGLAFIVAGLLILYAVVSLDGPITMMSEMSQAKAAAGVEWATATGAGQRIGLLQFDTFRMSDVADWASLVGLPASTLSRLSQVSVNGGVSAPGPNQVEVLLDTGAVLLLAPGADVVVYSAPFTGARTSFQTLFNRMINDGVTIISNSWTYCEDQTSLADVQSIDAILAAAAGAGISVLNATGDTGSTCLDGAPNTVGVPAGSPHGTAVGGTSLTVGPGLTYAGEAWWDGTNKVPQSGQGGFGISRFFSRPAYQDSFSSVSARSVPDVAINADPAGGMLLCQASAGGCPTGLRYGGTSLAAPTWSAIVARLNQARGENIGFLNPLLYDVAVTNPEAFNSPASMGSDFARVGLGSPNPNALHLALSGETVGPVDSGRSTLSTVLGIDVPVPADGTSDLVLVARLRDARGNAVPGKTVSLAPHAGASAAATPSSAMTDKDGAAAFRVTNVVVEEVTFTATDVTDGVVLASRPIVRFTHPPAAAGGIVASPTTVSANGVASTTITVTLQDALGRGAVGKLVTLSQGGGHSLITGPNPSVTDGSGQIQFIATNLVNEVVTYRATDVTDGDLPVPGEAVVTFTNGSGGACGQNVPIPIGLNGYTVTPFVTGFQVGPLFFSNVNYGGCSGVTAPAFFDGNLYVPNFLNGDLFKIGLGGGAVSNANKLSTLGPTLGWVVAGKDGRLYALRSGTGGNFNTGIVVELDPSTGAVLRTLASNLTCPQGLVGDPLSGDLFFIDACFGAGSDNPSLFRVKNPGSPTPTTAIYATLPFTPNGQVVFSPKGTIYVVSGYTQQNPPVIRVSGTNGPNPPTVTQLSGVVSNYWLNIGDVGPDGEATTLITLNNGKLKLTDITTNPPTTTAELTENIGGGIIGPDGCLYMPQGNALYKLTDPTGGCSFLPTNATPSLTLTPTAVSPNPAQGTTQTFTATFRNVNVPAGTPVLFQVAGANSQIKLVRTGATGEASFSYAAAREGTDTIVATAAVDHTQLTSNKAEVTWVPGRHRVFLTLSPSPATGMAGTPVTVKAALADVSQEPPVPVSGVSVQFAVAGASCAGTTDGAGLAACELMPTGGPGITTLTAGFAGNSGLTPASASTAFMLVGGGGDGLSAVGPAHLWVGLKNSDDVGSQFDLQVHVLIGDTLVAKGETLCVTGVARNPAAAREVVVPLALVDNGSTAGGDVLRVKVSTRIGTRSDGSRCAGPGGSHLSARGLRLYYDGAKAPSSLGLQLAADPLSSFYLDSNGGVCADLPSPSATSFSLDAAAPGTTASKCRDSGTIAFTKGNAWAVIGTWSLPLP